MGILQEDAQVSNIGTGGSYKELLIESDNQYLDWVRDFNQYDLYSKHNKSYDLEGIKDHYLPIADKYLGQGPIFW